MKDRSKYLYVPSDNEEEWDLPLTDEGSDEISLGKVATYAALLSPRGIRGKRLAGITQEIKAQICGKLLDLYRNTFGKSDDEIPAFVLNPNMEFKAFYFEESSEIEQIREGEYKGAKGLLLDGYLTRYKQDRYKDLVLPTQMLKDSTDYYYESKGVVKFEHGRDHKVGHRQIGSAYDHAFDDQGIITHDFIPEPSPQDGDYWKRKYEAVLNGEYKSFSPGGFFFRDTGEHKPPGIIIDWELNEHSVCKMPVNAAATFVVAAELKADGELSAAELPELIEQQPEITSGELTSAPAQPELLEKKAMDEEQIAALQARLAVLEADRAQAEAKALELETATRAKVEAERIVAAQAAAEAEQTQRFQEAVANEVKSLTSKMSTGLQLGLSLTGNGGRSAAFNVPNINGRRVMGEYGGWSPPTNAQSYGPGGKMTMSGPAEEQKAMFDEAGQQIPNRMIDWLSGVKHGQFHSELKSFANPASQQMTYQGGPGEVNEEGKNMTPGLIVSAANSPVGSAGGFVLPPSYLSDIVPYLVANGSIRDYVNVLPASALVMEVPRDSTPATRASVVAPGTTKPTLDFGTDLVEIRQYVLPLIVNITNQLLRHSRGTAEAFLRKKLIDAIRLAEFYYALNGTGSGQPKGILTTLAAADTAFPLESFIITRGSGTDFQGVTVPTGETVADATARAINANENRFYTPTALMLHNNDFWLFQKLKDSQNRYILDPVITGPVAMSIWNIPFVRTTLIPTGTAVLGDWHELYMYLGDNLLLDSSSEAGDRFDRNLTGFRIEEEMGMNADQNFRAFTKLVLS
jgi:HK97 family phage major capsid protein